MRTPHLTSRLRRALACSAILIMVPLVVDLHPQAQSSLQVPFVIIRLDGFTSAINGAYRFSQPYRKSFSDGICPTHPFQCSITEIEDFYLGIESPSDFGATELTSRLTGQRVFLATSIVLGHGQLHWPTSTEAVTDLSRGAPSPEPELLRWRSPFFSPDAARQSWDAVRDLAIVRELASEGPFGVLVIDHYYEVFAQYPRYELVVLVYGKPRAPVDAALLNVRWPGAVVTHGVNTVPEVRLHNFSDEPIDVDIEMEILADGAVLRRKRQSVGALAADLSAIVSFGSFVPVGKSPVRFRARLRGAGDGDWLDAWADNDLTERLSDVEDLPVFRALPDGAVPLGGWLRDFDDDGDLDIIRSNSSFSNTRPPVFLRNDGSGRYTDLTATIPVALPERTLSAFAFDFTGDNRTDVLLGYERAAILLEGTGSGAFSNVTSASGLDGLVIFAPTPLDFDTDGDLDILARELVGTSSSRFRVLLNDGAGHFHDGTTGTVIEGLTGIFGDASTGFVDADDREDLVLGGWSVPTRVYQNLGQGAYRLASELANVTLIRRASAFDMDGDGLSELFLGGFRDNRLLRQRAPFDFDEVTAQAGALGPTSAVAPFDLDDDGRLDLAMASPHRLVRQVNGVFVDESRLLVHPDAPAKFSAGSMVQTADLDEDGDLDLYYSSVAFENLGRARPTLEARVDLVAAWPHSRSNEGPNLLGVVARGAPGLDVREVEPLSLIFGPAGAPLAHNGCPHIADLDRDGHDDLIAHFLADRTGLTPVDEKGCLDGALRDGTPMRGCTGVNRRGIAAGATTGP